MDTLLQVGLSNAVFATVLALIAGLATVLWRRRPALVHGLWLLVLLKLLTPPLVRVPLPDMTSAPPLPTFAMANDSVPGPLEDCAAAVEAADNAAIFDSPQAVERHSDESKLHTRADADRPAPPATSQPATMAAQEALPPLSFKVADWKPALLGIWLAGAMAWFLLAGVRLARFARHLRYAVAAPDAVQEEADRIAGALGMRWCPVVQLLPGRLPPMVWAGAGPPRLLMPAELFGQMDAEALNTLMAHELAHLRRGDHRVRLVEFLAMGLFWWHPVVWIARRALREAEEQCCDAWVVSALPGAGKTYASALMGTLDFLAAAPASPPLACGIGQVSDLKRRMTMIMRGATPRALCWREGLAVLGLATLLPLLPTLARAEPDDAREPERRKNTEEKKALKYRFNFNTSDDEKTAFRFNFDTPDDEKTAAAQKQSFVVRRDDKSPDIEKAKAELKRLESELQKKLQEVREVSRRLKEAAEKIQREEVEKAKTMAKDMAQNLSEKISKQIKEKMGREVRVEVDGKEMKGRRMILEGPIEIEVTVDGKTLVRKLESGGRARTVPAPAATPAPAAGAAPAAAPAPAAPERTEGGRAMRRTGRDSGDGDRRMDQLERRLDAMMRELEMLRKDKSDSQQKAKEKRPGRNRSSDESEED